ncbi:hypothetical protein D9M72_555430 [compost metagenome]
MGCKRRLIQPQRLTPFTDQLPKIFVHRISVRITYVPIHSRTQIMRTALEERGHPDRRLRQPTASLGATRAAEQPDLDVMTQGNRIGARTLDLNCPWDFVRAQLEDVAGWLND